MTVSTTTLKPSAVPGAASAGADAKAHAAAEQATADKLVKRRYAAAADHFNRDMKKGLQFLQAAGLLTPPGSAADPTAGTAETHQTLMVCCTCLSERIYCYHRVGWCSPKWLITCLDVRGGGAACPAGPGPQDAREVLQVDAVTRQEERGRVLGRARRIQPGKPCARNLKPLT